MDSESYKITPEITLTEDDILYAKWKMAHLESRCQFMCYRGGYFIVGPPNQLHLGNLSSLQSMKSLVL